jgi:hypothetical protein
MSDTQKINIGFIGGQSLPVRVSDEELAKLRSALDAAGWHDLATEDGAVTIDLAKVVYVLTDTQATRVGFGT